ncbi:hypothetical protein [Rhodovarius lipocyclicus]|nr:hypothetical protein [Rhodovarius lipocyclicus]
MLVDGRWAADWQPVQATDALSERIYPSLNNGVYRAGFATTQPAYEAAFRDVFANWPNWRRGWPKAAPSYWARP